MSRSPAVLLVLMPLVWLCGCPPAPKRSTPIHCRHPEPGLTFLEGTTTVLASYGGGLVGLAFDWRSWRLVVIHGTKVARELPLAPWPVANMCLAADEHYLYWVYSDADHPRRCLLVSGSQLIWVDDRNGVIYSMPKSGGTPVVLARGAPTELAIVGGWLFWGSNRPGSSWKRLRPHLSSNYFEPIATSREHLGTVLRMPLGGGAPQQLVKPAAEPIVPEALRDDPAPALRRIALPRGTPETVWAPQSDRVIGSVAVDGRFAYTTDGRSVVRIAHESGEAEVLKQLQPSRGVSLLAYDGVLYWAELEMNEEARRRTVDDGSGVWAFPEAVGRPIRLLRGVGVQQLLARGCNLLMVVEHEGVVRLPVWAPPR